MPDGAKLDRPIALAGSAIVTVPNAISLARLCAVPLAVWLVLRQDMREAFWLFLAAGLSDGVDGWLARRGAGSRLGAVLDPIADKLLLTSMYIVLAAVHLLPLGLAILVVFRDIMIVGGVMLISLVGEGVVIAPLLISKVNTALQIALVALVLMLTGFGLHAPLLLTTLIWCVVVTTVLSGALYVRKEAKGGRDGAH
jgi:cardiolipin synthase